MSNLDKINRYMPTVLEYKNFLLQLSNDWNTLDRLARINNTGISIAQTREAFSKLSESLLENLVNETYNKVSQEMSSKSQVIVDIVIRNLFERTADIGFLATDEDIRAFLKTRVSYIESKKTQNTELSDNLLKKYQKDKEKLRKRFFEYVAKYSVYYDIILLSPEGKVLAKMNNDNNVTQSNDPLIKESLETKDDYVETYRYNDLQPNNKKSLVYSYKVTNSNDDDTPIGVLALFFKFEDELEGVFKHLIDEKDWMVLTLLDKDGYVISSSDHHQIPLDTKLETTLDKDENIVRFAGREYLAKTSPTKGYEGFFGLGWYGHVMIPIEYAFEEAKSLALNSMENEFLENVINTSNLFSDEVKFIPNRAEKIQRELDRTVNNGKLIDETGTTGMVLGEISSAGSKTKDIFEDSIKNLNETVISSFLADVEFSAKLAIDIMDRNLYERANDCRWWALAGDFRKILAKNKIDDNDKQKLEDILSYINNLYTVYTNLFIYDKNGEILAISMPKGERENEPIQFLNKEKWISKTIKDKWVEETLKIVDSQQYTVSSFSQTNLYEDGGHTYIYNASIRDIDESNKSIGGIGIIFDSTPQFYAMLDDALPKDENNETKNGAIGFFVQKDKTIISSTDKSFSIGTKLNIDNKFFELNQGESISDIISFNDYNYAIGASCSEGYREYKSEQDTYKNDVISIILNPIGKAQQSKVDDHYHKPEKLLLTIPQDILASAPSTKIITFYLDGHWFGLKAQDCECTVGLDGLTPVLAKEKNFVYGFKTYKNETVYVINMTHDLQPSMDDVHSDSDIIIVKIDDNPYIKYVGILTEQIGEIKNFPDSMIDSLKSIISNTDLFSTAIIRNPEDEKSEMITLIDQNKIARRLIDPEKR